MLVLIVFMFGSGDCEAQLFGTDRLDSDDSSLGKQVPAGLDTPGTADRQARFDLLYAVSKDIYNS